MSIDKKERGVETRLCSHSKKRGRPGKALGKVVHSNAKMPDAIRLKFKRKTTKRGKHIKSRRQGSKCVTIILVGQIQGRSRSDL